MFEYVKASKEWMLKELVEMGWVLKDQDESGDEYRKRMERERREDWKGRCFMESFFVRLRRWRMRGRGIG